MKQRFRWWHAALLMALLLATLSPLASRQPDGLQTVARDEGFLGNARDAFISIVPHYRLPGIGNETLASVLAGLLGVLLVFGLICTLGWLLRRRTTEDTGGPDEQRPS